MRGAGRRRYLLRALAPSHATQPATLLWRVFEVEAILTHVRLAGTGIDVGAGDGSLAQVIFSSMRPPPTVIGIEPDQQDAQVARRSGVYTRVHRTTGDRIPEPAGSMDFVFSNSTLEHIEHVEPVIAEAARVLRVGGQLVFTVPSERFHGSLAGDPLMRVLAQRAGRTYEQRLDERLAHRAYRGPSEWRTLLLREDLRVDRLVRYFPGPAVRAWERLSGLTSGILFELAGGRLPPRGIQRRIGLARRTPPVVSRLAVSVLELLFARALESNVREDEPSGGLLVLATRLD